MRYNPFPSYILRTIKANECMRPAHPHSSLRRSLQGRRANARRQEGFGSWLAAFPPFERWLKLKLLLAILMSSKRRLWDAITREPFDVEWRAFAQCWNCTWSTSSPNFVWFGWVFVVRETFCNGVAIERDFRRRARSKMGRRGKQGLRNVNFKTPYLGSRLT